MGKYHGIGGFRIGKVGNERYYLRKSSNVVAVAKPYRAINSQWIKQEEFKEYILSLLNVAIPQVYLLDALPEEIFPYALLFVQNENALGVYLDKDGVRTQLQLGGGGGSEYTGSDPISVDQYVKRIRLKMGSGLRLDEDGRLVAEGEGGGEYIGEAPINIDAETRTISVTRYNTQASWNEQREEDANLLGSGIIKKNVESKVSKSGVQSPLSVNANDELVLGVGSGLELNSGGTDLQIRIGSGLKFGGAYHVEADLDYLRTEINKVERRSGNTAFIYNSNTSAGLTISGDYDSTNAPRTLLVMGQLCHLNFTLKGSSVTSSANWTYLGQIQSAYRPSHPCTVVGMTYNGTQNEACGGYLTTDGWVVIWCNAKPSTNNYQIRISATYNRA